MNSVHRAALGKAIGQALHHIPLCAVFVYGSVAAGTTHPASDVDTFVLTHTDVGQRRRLRVREDFRRLQTRLGYRPDPEFPVEIFSIEAVDAALHALATAIEHGTVDALASDGDEHEVLRALTDPRWVLTAHPELDRLTGRACELARRLIPEAVA